MDSSDAVLLLDRIATWALSECKNVAIDGQASIGDLMLLMEQFAKTPPVSPEEAQEIIMTIYSAGRAEGRADVLRELAKFMDDGQDSSGA